MFKCLFVIQPLKSVQENVLLCLFLWHDWFSIKSKEVEWWLRSLWDLWCFVLKVKMVCAVQSMCCIQKYMHNCKLILWTPRYTVNSGTFVAVAFIVSVNVTWTGKFWKWKYILSDGSGLHMIATLMGSVWVNVCCRIYVSAMRQLSGASGTECTFWSQ